MKEVPLTKECHCGNIADKYRQRRFINQLNQEVNRAFYRCRNCWSRIHEDFIPEMETMQRANVFDLIKSLTNKSIK